MSTTRKPPDHGGQSYRIKSELKFSNVNGGSRFRRLYEMAAGLRKMVLRAICFLALRSCQNGDMAGRTLMEPDYIQTRWPQASTFRTIQLSVISAAFVTAHSVTVPDSRGWMTAHSSRLRLAERLPPTPLPLATVTAVTDLARDSSQDGCA